MKRAEKAKRKAASATSDGEVVAAESDDSRQGAARITSISKLNRRNLLIF